MNVIDIISLLGSWESLRPPLRSARRAANYRDF